MGRKKARNLDQLPIDVHVTEQWSDDSVIALYNSPSRDPNRRFAAVGSLSDSEYGTADSESFNSYNETKKQTKFLEELLNYTESASLDSEGNELGPHGDSSDSYSDWDSRVGYRRNPTSYSNGSSYSYSNVSSSSEKPVPNKSRNVNGSGSAFGGMMGLFACCTYPANQTVGEQQPQQQPQVVQPQPTPTPQAPAPAPAQPTMLPLKQSALVAQTENNDILDHIFNGFENVVCHDSEDPLVVGTGANSKDPIVIVDDDRDDRILAPTTQPPTQTQSSVIIKKSDNDILDNIFEKFEGFVCREDMDTVETTLRVGARTTTGNSTDDAQRTPAAVGSAHATTPSTTKAMTTMQPTRDILDSVFEGVEYAMCRDGPPVENYTQNNTKRDNYYSAAARNGFVQSHRGDWRPKQPQGYSFERDSSIVSTSNGSSKLVEKNSYKFSRKLKTKNRQDMLDFVFDGVESMVCKDDDLVGGQYNIQNVRSQFDEDLPNKRFHWDDE